jgi:hypothetical protein
MKKVNVVLIIAAIGLFVALLDMQRDYYQLLRWAVCIVGLFSAFLAYRQKKIAWMCALAITAVLFNPIVPLHVHRETWQMLYGAGGAVCLIAAFMVELK